MKTICGTILAVAMVWAYAALADGGGLVFDWREDSLVLRDKERNENLFYIPEGRLFLPDFAKNAALASHEKSADGAFKIRFSGGDLENGVVTVSLCMRGFKVNGMFTPKRDVVMWNVGTPFDVVIYE